MPNRLIEGARQGRPPRYWRAGLYLIVVFGLTVMVIAVMISALMVVGAISLDSVAPDSGMGGLRVLGFIAEVLMIGLTWLWVRLIEQRPFWTIGLRTPRPLLEWARGLAVGAGLNAAIVGLIALSGAWAYGGAPGLLDPGAVLPPVLVALAFFLIQGPAEEVVFRGYLLPVLGARGGMVVGVAVSSVVFGLAHSLNPNVNPVALLNVGLAGLFFALYALLEEGLWGVFGAHTAWNWLMGHFFGLPVSGMGTESSVLRLADAGPDGLTGGAWGPEASLVLTAVLLVVCGWMAWRLWRRSLMANG
jgi:membrane protease YdiL (CAAX protease family)